MSVSPDKLAEYQRTLGLRAIKGLCSTGKRAHGSRELAEREAARINAKPPRVGPLLPAEAFLCRRCGHWHIGRSRR